MVNRSLFKGSIPLGLNRRGFRTESDSLGKIKVPADRYWGAQTQRSLYHFNIADDKMPKNVYHTYGIIKNAAARVNKEAGRLDNTKAKAIIQASLEVEKGWLDENFPLCVWQTGSGTQTNMNVNEVIANRAIQLLGGKIGSKIPVHPNDHVNMGQSSNDSFPTVMHVSTVLALEKHLFPELNQLVACIEGKAEVWSKVVKIGRTHLQDAVPLTVGQEWSGWAYQLKCSIRGIKKAEKGLFKLAAGGTAVGTGLNAPKGFSNAIANKIAKLTSYPFVTAPNKFAALSSVDAMVSIMASLRGLATVLIKIANDIRWLASGPCCGLGELHLPDNEPGSSIMPGKVNPTQCEAMIMVCTHVIGLDVAVAMAGLQGNFQLNVTRPMVVTNVLHACRLLADMSKSFRKFLIEGTTLNEKKIQYYVDHSLMLVTALAPVVGYDGAAEIARLGRDKNLNLKQAALQSGLLTENQFDQLINPTLMAGHGVKGA
ncbi:Fumarate hydratase class II [Commensalibacter sp. Nvir]|uniref:class II fumarate hydratase n=1 Tax=Commensalibacter sp. Nvir TaxID=3069817 RepID=UPI002D382D55|nr:Fumarate hydratase class II [Commensalibacter sp. Nvir]